MGLWNSTAPNFSNYREYSVKGSDEGWCAILTIKNRHTTTTFSSMGKTPSEAVRNVDAHALTFEEGAIVKVHCQRCGAPVEFKVLPHTV